MSNVVENLDVSLTKELKNADEIWIAVALLTRSGLNLLQKQVMSKTIQHYLIGINLPTEPGALKLLHKLEVKDKIQSRIYTEKTFFHPKVYLIRKGESYSAFIGSANCTSSGLSKNVELTYKIANQEDGKKIKKWFDLLFETSVPIKSSFLKQYEENFEKRKSRKAKDEAEAEKLKRALREEYVVTMEARNELIKVLKWHRRQPIYKQHTAEREEDIKNLRKSLDYPNFKNIDIDKFFGIWQLGHLISIPIPTLKREIKKFRKLLLFLCNESIPVEDRINEVLDGNLKIRGVAEATISKILTIHNPNKYSVRNNKIDSVLYDYGIEVPQRISKGEKYNAVNNFLKELARESKMENMAVLDLYLYTEAND